MHCAGWVKGVLHPRMTPLPKANVTNEMNGDQEKEEVYIIYIKKEIGTIGEK